MAVMLNAQTASTSTIAVSAGSGRGKFGPESKPASDGFASVLKNDRKTNADPIDPSPVDAKNGSPQFDEEANSVDENNADKAESTHSLNFPNSNLLESTTALSTTPAQLFEILLPVKNTGPITDDANLPLVDEDSKSSAPDVSGKIASRQVLPLELGQKSSAMSSFQASILSQNGSIQTSMSTQKGQKPDTVSRQSTHAQPNAGLQANPLTNNAIISDTIQNSINAANVNVVKPQVSAINAGPKPEAGQLPPTQKNDFSIEQPVISIRRNEGQVFIVRDLPIADVRLAIQHALSNPATAPGAAKGTSPQDTVPSTFAGLTRPTASYQVQLLPKQLGAITLFLEKTDAGIRVTAEVQKVEAKHILLQDNHKLTEALKVSGFAIDAVDIRHNPDLEVLDSNNRQNNNEAESRNLKQNGRDDKHSTQSEFLQNLFNDVDEARAPDSENENVIKHGVYL